MNGNFFEEQPELNSCDFDLPQQTGSGWKKLDTYGEYSTRGEASGSCGSVEEGPPDSGVECFLLIRQPRVAYMV